MGSSDDTYIGDTGYRFNFKNFGNSTSAPIVYMARRVNLASNNLLGSSADWGDNNGNGGSTYYLGSGTADSGSVFAGSTTYTYELFIRKLSDADVKITTRITGGSLSGLAVTAHDTTNSGWRSFDQLSLRLSTGNNELVSMKLNSLVIDTTLPAAFAPSITTQPTDQSVISGSAATFTVAADGSEPQSYQWYKGSTATPVSGGTAASLVLANAQASDAGSYFCTVSNAGGSAISSAATLTVVVVSTPPSVTTPPAAQAVVLNGTATFSITASGTAPLSYQWRKDGVALDPAAIPSAATATLTLASVQTTDVGAYDCVVTNDVGTATSDSRHRPRSTRERRPS